MTITRKVRSGGYDWPDWDPAGHDDHLVKARVPDETEVGGILEKTVDTATVTREVETVGGVERVAFTAHPEGLLGDADPTDVDALSVADPGVAMTAARIDHKHDARVFTGTTRPPGLGSPGDDDDDTLIKGTHDHPPGPGPNPTVEGAKLYTAAIPGPQSLVAKGILAPVRKWANVKCVFCVGFGSEGGDPLAGFTESPAGTFTRDVNGAIPSMWIDDLTAGAGQDVEAGDSVLVWYVHPTYEGVVLEHQTICEVLDPGSPSTPVQLRRRSDADSSDDYIYGKCVNVESGTEFSGHTFVFTGATQPTLGTSQMPFSDHGTSSIYKTIPDGKYGFETLWTKVAGAICTWEKHGEGANGDPQPPTASRWLQSDWIPGLVASVGNYYLVLEDSPYDGLYEIQAVPGVRVDGSPNYQQIMRRVVEANTAETLTGMVAHIVADAGMTVFLDGIYFKQVGTIETIDGDAPEWDLTETDPSPPTDCLLTFAQQGQAGSGYWGVSKTFTGSAMLWQNSLLTLAGTPGVAEIPAGRETMQLRLIAVEGWNPATNPGEVTATVKLANGTTGAPIFSSTCPVKLGPTPPSEPIQWQYDLAEAVALAQGDLLSYNVEVASTCASPVTVVFYYGDPNWGNWVQLAGVTFPIGGTDDHQALRRRDQDVASATVSKADPCHPWSALGPSGRKHVKLGAATLTGEGATRTLVMPEDCSVARLVPETSEFIYGIDRTGFSVVGVDTADEIRIHVQATESYKVTFVHDASSTVGEDAMWIDDTEKNMECSAIAILRFVRDPDSSLWRLL